MTGIENITSLFCDVYDVCVYVMSVYDDNAHSSQSGRKTSAQG